MLRRAPTALVRLSWSKQASRVLSDPVGVLRALGVRGLGRRWASAKPAVTLVNEKRAREYDELLKKHGLSHPASDKDLKAAVPPAALEELLKKKAATKEADEQAATKEEDSTVVAKEEEEVPKEREEKLVEAKTAAEQGGKPFTASTFPGPLPRGVKLEPGEVLLYASKKGARHAFALTAALIPSIFGATQLWMNLIDAPFQTKPWVILTSFGASAIMYFMTWRFARTEVHHMVVTNGGTHVRIVPFGFMEILDGMEARLLTISNPLLRSNPDTIAAERGVRRALGGHLVVNTGKHGLIPDQDMFEAVCMGYPVHLPGSRNSSTGADATGNAATATTATATTATADPTSVAGLVGRRRKRDLSVVQDPDLVYWKEAKDSAGRTYFYHEVTRETRWTKPGTA